MRVPPHAVTSEPATAPRLSASRKVSDEPRSKPLSRISWGNQVPRPYQANSVARVARANSTVARVNGGRSSDRSGCRVAGWTCAAASPGSSPNCRSSRSASACRPWVRNQTGDSGSSLRQSGMTATRASRATRNIASQPKRGRTKMPVSAARLPPMGTPDIISVETTERLRGPTYSAARALALGTRPPRPRPARSRNVPNVSGLGATAHSAVKTENHTVQARIVLRRPMRSETVPASTAPISMPANARLPSRPAPDLVRPQPGSTSSCGSTCRRQ